MLITPDNKQAEVDAEAASQQQPLPDGPPPYSPLNGSSARTPFRPRPTDIPSTNYVKIKRKNSAVRGTYVIDPGLNVPHDTVTIRSHESGSSDEGRGLEPAGHRAHNDVQVVAEQKNLYLESHNASISANVWLIDDEIALRGEVPAEQKRAELEFRSHNASVNVKLDYTTTRPFALAAHSKNAAVNVAIPSDFVGPVTITTANSGVSLLGSIKSGLATFSEENGTRICFLGDYKAAGYTGKWNWHGSSIDIGSHNGRVTLSFIEEEEQNRGFWSKLFGKVYAYAT